MAEATTQVDEPRVEPIVTPEPVVSPVVETQPEVKPGGDDGQAVRARKEYERRVEAERETQSYRERLASVEGELRALRSGVVTTQTPKAPTIAEIDRAIQAGTVTQAEAAAYLAEAKANELYTRKEQERQARELQAKPIEEATREVNEYVRILPGLNDKSDPRWSDLQETALDIQSKLGIPQGPVLAMLALRQVYGPVAKLQKGNPIREATRNAQASTQPGAGAAGASNVTSSGDKSDLLTKVPKALQDAWNKYGTDPKDRITEAEIYLKTQARLNK